MRWLWFVRTGPQHTWSDFQFTNGSEAESSFAASISVAVRDDRKALFWLDNWLDGCSIQSLARSRLGSDALARFFLIGHGYVMLSGSGRSKLFCSISRFEISG